MGLLLLKCFVSSKHEKGIKHRLLPKQTDTIFRNKMLKEKEKLSNKRGQWTVQICNNIIYLWIILYISMFQLNFKFSLMMNKVLESKNELNMFISLMRCYTDIGLDIGYWRTEYPGDLERFESSHLFVLHPLASQYLTQGTSFSLAFRNSGSHIYSGWYSKHFSMLSLPLFYFVLFSFV